MCDCAAKLEQIEQRVAALETGNRTKVRQDYEFELFWARYPKKVGKKAAQKAFQNAQNRPQIDDLLDAVDRAMKSEQWRKDGGQFIPNPATWLNQGRWDDEPVQIVPVLPKAQQKVERATPTIHRDYEPPPPEVMALLSRIGKGM